MATRDATRDDWTAPGCFEVAPDVYRVPLPLPNDGLRAVNVYVVVADDGLVLIDSGWAIAEARDRLAESLATIGHATRDVRRILVTHVHLDHYTLGVELRREFGMDLLLGAGERRSLEAVMDSSRSPLAAQVERLHALGAATVARDIEAASASRARPAMEWELPDAWIDDLDTTSAGDRVLEAVPTPGHTRGHVVFRDAQDGLLFAGDHVLPHITPSIGFEPILSPNPLGDFLASLATVRSLPDARLLPAHGPVGASVHARIDALTEHHGSRLDATEAAVRGGATTGYEVASRLHWTRREKRLADLDVFNQMLAVLETGAHLTLLVAQGRLREVPDGVLHYFCA